MLAMKGACWLFLRPGLTACVFLALGACSSIGAGSVPRDRIDYLGAVADSWKEQTLLNIVRLRYADAPVFLDVSSIISSYALQTQVAANGQVQNGSFVSLGATANYSDKPTITYTPLTGKRFVTSLLTPIPPSTIFSLIQAGFPADFVLRTTVRAINGIYNHSSEGGVRPADPQFDPLVAAIRRLQQSGVLGMRLEKRGPEEASLLSFPANPSPEERNDIQFLSETLKLKLENNEILLSFGATQSSANDLAVLSRSMTEILIELAAGAEVPAEHVAQGRTFATPATTSAAASSDRPIVRIHSGSARPDNAFVAVHYRDTWYWIDDGDFAGKRAFTSLLMFFSLAETGVTPQAPVLTVPAN